MSNLNSAFDILRGWPHGSALEGNFEPAPDVVLPEGTLVYVTTRQLDPAVVLRMVNDTLTSAPTLALADRGKAYVVGGTGGGWGSFAVGDIVEWTGTTWQKILSHSGGKPPSGTRVVVVESGAAGAFANQEEKIGTFNGTSWTFAAPSNGNRIKIVGANSVYENKYYDYVGAAPPAGAWVQSAAQREAPAIVRPLTSAKLSDGWVKDHAWIVIQGNDQYDSRFVNKITCLKCASGSVIKVATAIAGTLSPADLVCANDGALKKLATGNNMEWPIGQVLHANGTEGWVIVATY